MKKISISTFTFVLFLYTFNVTAQGIDFKDVSFKDALNQAKIENKLVFLDAYTTWCGPCKVMSKNVFPEKEVGDFMNPNFISLKIDMEKGEGIELAKQYNVYAYPTLLFFDHNGKVVHTKIGGADVQTFISEAKIAKDPTKQLPYLTEKYKSGDRNIAFVSQYIEALCNANMKDEEAKVGETYMSQMPVEQYATEHGFNIIKHTGVDYKNEVYSYFIKNSQEFIQSEKIGKQGYDQLISNAISTHILELAEKGTLKQLKTSIDEAKNDYIFDMQEDMESYWYNQYFIANKQYDSWLDNVDDQVSKLAKTDVKRAASTYINTAYQIAMDTTYRNNTDVYRRAITMANSALEIDDTSNGANYCLATLYKNLGDRQAALKSIEAYLKNSKEADNSRALALKKEIENI